MWPCSAREGSAALSADIRKWCVNIAALDAEDVGDRVYRTFTWPGYGTVCQRAAAVVLYAARV